VNTVCIAEGRIRRPISFLTSSIGSVESSCLLGISAVEVIGRFLVVAAATWVRHMYLNYAGVTKTPRILYPASFVSSTALCGNFREVLG